METIVYKLRNKIEPLLISNRLSDKNGFILLLSAMPGHPHSRYSFLCIDPFLTFRVFDSICEVGVNNSVSYVFGNPWEILSSLLQRYEIDDELDLPLPAGGAFGYFGYDLKNHIESKISTDAIKDIPMPDCCLCFYDGFVVVDHANEDAFIVSTGICSDGSRSRAKAIARIEQWARVIDYSTSYPEFTDLFGDWNYKDLFEFDIQKGLYELNSSISGIGGLYSTFSKKEFTNAVSKAKQYIHRGDIYQVNLSQRFEICDIGVSPFDLFRNLTFSSPSPFAAFMNFGDFKLASSSPELFLKIDNNHIVTKPIKGTRPRGLNPEQDRRLHLELCSSEKERAELVMITDLLRNDLGRVCEFGSVKTTDLLRVEKHPTVYHMISTIEGELKENTTHLHALAVCFPGGSITGAPKIRAMQIIDELEPTARGIYTGTHGYIGFNPHSQLSITIRTAVCAKNKVWYQAGAGIVADSDPEFEYEETIAKTGAFFKAISLTEERIEIVH